MPELTLDFGLLIAYFVPGFISLLGLKYWVSGFKLLIEDVDKNEHRVASTLAIVALALVLGLAVSICRFAVIDYTFKWELPGSTLQEFPHHRSLERVDPEYSRFVDQGPREALLLAERNEKRPYQFYGNSLLAITLFLIAWLTKEPWKKNKKAWTARAWKSGGALILATLILYFACRSSYYRYAKAVRQLNELTTASGGTKTP